MGESFGVIDVSEAGWTRCKRDVRLERPIGKHVCLAFGLSSLDATVPSRGCPAE